ncbi:hypothetical protein GCM10010329_75160 [Streptomyces spiroverticillatus]|uniref:Uncharacterized protein n=1 Tax=Streptomyces finlayi TaxID=67296 RepID=A0A919CF60_9ACTN|nr:hypothetical protein GCM10010329_75160 [Streptomyces spiroverticillatus]GHD16882.1 hypothetical protein GCM10010334_78320 [Streptomyces finlayi]
MRKVFKSPKTVTQDLASTTGTPDREEDAEEMDLVAVCSVKRLGSQSDHETATARRRKLRGEASDAVRGPRRPTAVEPQSVAARSLHVSGCTNLSPFGLTA